MKEDLINYIVNVCKIYGCFFTGELETFDSAPCIGTLGKFVGLAEYFTEDYCEINIYNPSSFSSDPIDTYDTSYDKLEVEQLQEIANLCGIWEAQSLQTEKRINN